MNKKEKAARQIAWYREQINAILSGPGIAASVIGGIAEELDISEQPPDDWEPTPLTTEKLSALIEACEFYSEARLSAATATTEFDVIDAEHRMREGLKRIEAATAAARSSAKKPREVSSCPNCPLTDGGEEWQGVCHANPLKPRALPKNHDPDGPPPKWCPLPITITRKPRDVDERIEADERKRAPLTWREWSEAAGYSSRASMSASHLRAARKAWREGVSPAEYRRRVNRGEL